MPNEITAEYQICQGSLCAELDAEAAAQSCPQILLAAHSPGTPVAMWDCWAPGTRHSPSHTAQALTAQQLSVSATR